MRRETESPPLDSAKATASGNVAIVIIEAGGRWPLWLEEVRIGSPDVETLVQHGEEPRAELVARVMTRLRTLLAQGQQVQTLVLACNGATDRNSLIARAQIGKAAVAAMSKQREGQVLLTAHQGLPELVAPILSKLAASLQAYATAGVNVGTSVGQSVSGFWAKQDIADAPDCPG